MSIKVYGGIKFKIDHLNTFLEFVYLEEHIVMIEKVKRIIKWKPTHDEKEQEELIHKWKMLLEALLKNQNSFSDRLNWNCGWNLWIVDKFVYGYPWGGRYGESKFKCDYESLSFVQNYSYWNNTDKDENVTIQEWEERETLWRKLLNKFPIGKVVYDTVGFRDDWYFSEAFVIEKLGFKNLISCLKT